MKIERKWKWKKNHEINCKPKFNVSSWDKQFYFKTLIEEAVTSTAVFANLYGVTYSSLFDE